MSRQIRRRFVGLRFRFVLLSATILIIVFSGLTLILVRNNTEQLRQVLTDQSIAFATLATRPVGETFVLYKESGRILIDKEVRDLQALNRSVTNITVVDTDGEVLYSFNEADASSVPASLASTFEDRYIYDEDGLIQSVIAPYFESNGSRRYTVIYTVSSTEIKDAIRRETIAIVSIGIGSLLATSIGTYVFINRYILKPIANVSTQASSISAGNLEQQIVVKRHDEIGSLAESVNHMAQSLKANINELKEIDKVKTEFMMITSHNLRTPLTIMSGYLEGIDKIDNPDALKNALQNIAASTKRLSIFAEDILHISQLELGEKKMQHEITNIDELISQIAEEIEPVIATKQLTFIKDIPKFGLSIPLDKPQFRSALLNLLDNAVKFTGEGGQITLRLSTSPKEVRIAVSDTGIGISPEELPKLFTKFHRGTSTFTYNYEGVGIGLYATKVVVEQLGGTILVDSQPGQGSTFTIVLPFEKLLEQASAEDNLSNEVVVQTQTDTTTSSQTS